MDIVERLRQEIGYTLEIAEADMREAADEIERLREALRKIANGYSDEDGMRNIARQALGGKE